MSASQTVSMLAATIGLVERDPAGQLGPQRHVLAGADAAAPGDQQHVVEGQAEAHVVETHVVAP